MPTYSHRQRCENLDSTILIINTSKMTNNKIIVAGVVGAMSLLLIGSLIFGLTLPQFGETLNGSAIGVMKNPEEFGWIPLIIGHLAYGWLFAIIFGRWANISTFAGGVKAGLILAALISMGNELISFGSTNVDSFTGTLVNIVLGTIVFALMGGVVGAMLGRGEK